MSSLHIHRWGPEPARVLLLHGITSSGATMWQLGEGLAERGVVAPDLLGHGESPDSEGYRAADSPQTSSPAGTSSSAIRSAGWSRYTPPCTTPASRSA